MPKIQIKRGTVSQVNSAAASNNLSIGELYFLTDEDRIAIGKSASQYISFAKLSEAGGGASNLDGGNALSVGSALTAIDGGNA